MDDFEKSSRQPDDQTVVIKNELEGNSGKNGTALAVISLVMGILSIVICFTGCVSVIAGIAGLVCGIVSLATKRPGSGLAIAGTITSGSGLVLGFIGMIFLIALA